MYKKSRKENKGSIKNFRDCRTNCQKRKKREKSWEAGRTSNQDKILKQGATGYWNCGGGGGGDKPSAGYRKKNVKKKT